MAPKATIKKGKKAKKDPNAPKRALSSYMFFAKEKRSEIIAKNPELAKDVAAVGKMIGSAWNALDEAKKAPFEKLAAEDRARYEKEKAAYKKA
ncbi:high mobility group protein-like protein NHP1 [Babesia divergens]|uniref:High mobility group protein-like protein NHP1 n=1 Tax=Babesia divergens TaxID=32595 RepID=A0AAD9GE77_BABDI|nr:high mobility group protein-like protein NHP1 [Babesia divergens]